MSEHRCTPPRARGHALVLAGALGIWLLLLLPSPAYAHAVLISTDPAQGEVLPRAPEQVTFTFNEQVRLVEDGAHLFDASGEEIDVQARSVDEQVLVDMPETLADGTYVVTWRVISADGHPISGSLTFSVGAPSEEVASISQGGTPSGMTIVQGIVQGGFYLGLLAAVGLAVFTRFLLPGERALATIRARLRRAVRLAAVLAVVAAVLLVPITTAYQQGLPLSGLLAPSTWTEGLVSTDALVALLVACGLGLVLLGLSEPSSRFVRSGHPQQSEHPRQPAGEAGVIGGGSAAVVLAGGLVSLAALSLVGHTRAYGPVALVITTDVLHVAAGAVWFGGLVGLVLTLRTLRERETIAVRTLARFSTMAAGVLALLVAAGSVLAWRILGSWSALVETSFGLVLLAKVALVAAAVGVAAYNRYRLLPRVQTPSRRARRSAASMVRTTVRAEAALLVLVLGLTGFLVQQSPEQSTTASRAAPAGHVLVRASTDEVQVVAHIYPARVGRNTVLIQLQQPNGRPLDPYAPPTLSIRSEGLALGAQPLSRLGPGTYQTRVVFPTSGRWQLQVSVRTGKFENPVLTLGFTIRSRG